MKGSGSSAALRRARHRADGYNLATCWRRLATTSHQHAPHQGSSHCQQDTPHPSGSVQMLPTRRGSPEAVDDACVHRGPPSRLWAALQPRMDAMQGCERMRGPPCGTECSDIRSDQMAIMSASTPAHEWHCQSVRIPHHALFWSHWEHTRKRLHRPQPSK